MEKVENTRKNGILKKLIILFLVLFMVMLIGIAYARYITKLNGTTTADIAKWSFDSKILNSTQTAEVSNFSVTRTDNNLDVDQNTIAPGTSGEFILEIDATGTETLLTYETKMTLTNKPKNLKFYWDSNETQEIIIENETYLALNGFMLLSDNKKREIPIYWDWPLETGYSESEIEENDIIDTSFIGKTMSMQIATTGTQVTSNPYANKVASATINGKITVYNSVQDAIDAAGTNEGAIVTLLDDIQERISIKATQNIVLNMNGKSLSYDYSTILMAGQVTLVGNGTISAKGSSSNLITITIYPTGILTCLGNIEVNSGIKQGESQESRACMCYGQLNIYKGNFSGYAYGLTANNQGIINVYGGKVSGVRYAIANHNSAKVNIYNNAEIKGNGHALINAGNTTNNAIITIYGGTIIGIIGFANGAEGQIIDYRQ